MSEVTNEDPSVLAVRTLDFLQKYLANKQNDLSRNGVDPLNYENNYRAIRYADVLLMAAEAHANSDNESKAIDYLNQVRERAFGDNSQDYSLSEDLLLMQLLQSVDLS